MICGSGLMTKFVKPDYGKEPHGTHRGLNVRVSAW